MKIPLNYTSWRKSQLTTLWVHVSSGVKRLLRYTVHKSQFIPHSEQIPVPLQKLVNTV